MPGIHTTAGGVSANHNLLMDQIWQHNCRKSWKVWYELEELCGKWNPCCLLIQEPPLGYDGQPAHICGHVRITTGTDGDKVGIYVREGIVCAKIPVSKEGWIVFALIRIGTIQMVVGSVYLTPSGEIREQCGLVRDYARQVRRDRLLIGGDVNARSTWWHARKTDSRGGVIENLLRESDLYVYNRNTTSRDRGITLTLQREQ